MLIKQKKKLISYEVCRLMVFLPNIMSLTKEQWIKMRELPTYVRYIRVRNFNYMFVRCNFFKEHHWPPKKTLNLTATRWWWCKNSLITKKNRTISVFIGSSSKQDASKFIPHHFFECYLTNRSLFVWHSFVKMWKITELELWH